jgi:hypothetical protein
MFRIFQAAFMLICIFLLWSINNELFWFRFHSQGDIKSMLRQVEWIQKDNADFYKKLFEPVASREQK